MHKDNVLHTIIISPGGDDNEKKTNSNQHQVLHVVGYSSFKLLLKIALTSGSSDVSFGLLGEIALKL